MRLPAHVIVAILLYLVLDPCLASMPGAFVFDAADSVETVQRQRPQDAEAPVRALLRDSRDVVTHSAPKPRVVALNTPTPPRMPLRTAVDRSHAVSEFAPRSEDPH